MHIRKPLSINLLWGFFYRRFKPKFYFYIAGNENADGYHVFALVG